jgi:hypothetical protein
MLIPSPSGKKGGEVEITSNFLSKELIGMKRLHVFLLTVTLAAIALASTSLATEGWKTYTDKKFGFSVEYPAGIYNKTEGPYVDRDGISTFVAYSSTSNGEGKYAFSVSGGKKTKGMDGNSLLKKATTITEDAHGHVSGVQPIKGTAKSGANFYTYNYVDDSAGPGGVSHVYCVIGQTGTAQYSIRYPREEAQRFARITARMDKSLKAK